MGEKTNANKHTVAQTGVHLILIYPGAGVTPIQIAG
jgi:hypothetical protein